jgi:hypothetical protein
MPTMLPCRGFFRQAISSSSLDHLHKRALFKIVYIVQRSSGASYSVGVCDFSACLFISPCDMCSILNKENLKRFALGTSGSVLTDEAVGPDHVHLEGPDLLVCSIAHGSTLA